MISQIIIRAVNKVVDAIEEQGLDYAIFGGLALQAWKRLRSTLDVDAMVIIKEENINSLMNTILKKGLELDKENPRVNLGEITLLRFIYPDKESLVDIKVDIAVAEGSFPEQVMQNRIKLNVFGRDMWFVGCEDLILLKLLSNRPIDNADAKELIRINSKTINKDYLLKQAIKLKIDKRLIDIEKDM